jgi:hypothetical protein
MKMNNLKTLSLILINNHPMTKIHMNLAPRKVFRERSKKKNLDIVARINKIKTNSYLSLVRKKKMHMNKTSKIQS